MHSIFVRNLLPLKFTPGSRMLHSKDPLEYHGIGHNCCLWRAAPDTAVILIILPFRPNGPVVVGKYADQLKEKASMATSPNSSDGRFMGQRLQGVERTPWAESFGFRVAVFDTRQHWFSICMAAREVLPLHLIRTDKAPDPGKLSKWVNMPRISHFASCKYCCPFGFFQGILYSIG